MARELIVNIHFLEAGLPFSYHDRNRSKFQEVYGKFLRNEEKISNRVLDIGCGHGFNPAYAYFGDKIGRLDGVDPFPAIEPATNLTERWTCSLEELPVAHETYDMAYSYNVVEHIKDVDPFLSRVVEIIKPGSCYWSLSPNFHHPFSICTRIIQRAGLLNFYRKLVNPKANEYPAYYRISKQENVIQSIIKQNLAVEKIDFYYINCVNWDTYFPKILRFLPHMIDAIFLFRNPRRSFIFMFRLQKSRN
jgi:2-polyprenyl-3-methyl-5-hydroxy-6-metoxy-1,4-benzoquinol methylase